jgi:hypothetical protein
MRKPEPTEYAGFFAGYVNLVPEPDPLPVLASQLDEVLAFLRTVSEADASVLHAPLRPLRRSSRPVSSRLSCN